MLSAAERLAAEIGNDTTERPKSRRAPASGEFRLFAEANGVDTVAVLDRLDIRHEETARGEMATCPGCQESRALVCEHGGLKCLHDRCAQAGPPANPGFRTNVDLVMCVRQVEGIVAAKQICEWFGIKIPKSARKEAAAEPPPSDDYEHSETDAPDAPPDPNPEPSERAKTNTGRAAISITEVLTEWSQSGPLIHEPTGIPRLDELTGGGPVYGSRWYFPGAPDAGKTAFLVQLAHVFALRGVAVGLLAVDEEAGDLVTRLAQRVGYSRAHCEVRDLPVLAAMHRELGELPIRFYDGTWTIEDAAADLAAFAKLRAKQDPEAHPNGPRAMLGIDSIQTVHCAADLVALTAGRELSEVSAVTARVRAIRAMASRHRLIALTTSEFGRGAYRSPEPSQQTATLAAAKWSGAIEYSARVMVGLRSVAGEQDVIELEIAKNKHGPRDEKLHLRIDRRSQTLTPTVYDAPPKATAADRDATARDRVTTDSVVVARVLLAKPGASVRGLRSAVRVASGIGSERVDAALEALGAAVIYGRGSRGAKPMSLDLALLDECARTALEGAK